MTSKRSRAIEDLPEGCIAAILSHTTPVDAGRFSVVSKSFHSAADSDTVWNRFLTSHPQGITAIISNSPSHANAPTKKALYLALSDRHIIIDNGKKSFQLHRKSGQKCYMLAARSLTIECRCVHRVKELIPMDDSRFPEVAKLSLFYSHEIRGTINTLSLSPNTQYAAYLVFKMIYAYGQKNEPVCFNVGVDGDRRSVKSVCLDPDLEHWRKGHCNEEGLQRPTVRSDGWLEIEMGKFFNSSPKDEEVRMSVLQRSGYRIEGDLFIEGIEVSLSKRIKQYS